MARTPVCGWVAVLQGVTNTPDVTNSASGPQFLQPKNTAAFSNKEFFAMTTATMAANPFALMVDPASVKQQVDGSQQLSQLSQRQCHPLDRAVIRCASAEIAAYDAKIDRTTIYLPPEEDKSQPVVRTYSRRVN